MPNETIEPTADELAELRIRPGTTVMSRTFAELERARMQGDRHRPRRRATRRERSAINRAHRRGGDDVVLDLAVPEHRRVVRSVVSYYRSNKRGDLARRWARAVYGLWNPRAGEDEVSARSVL